MGIDCGPPPTLSFAEVYQVGSKVWYVPHICHAFNCNLNNEYPWTVGLKKNLHYQENQDTGEKELVEDIVEVEEGQLHRNVLPLIHRSPEPREERKRLVPLSPKNPWRATIERVHTDGTVDLDIESNVGNGMVTLQYSRIPVDEAGKTPHTCHKGDS